MKVRCISVIDDSSKEYYGKGSLVTLGKEYVVVALEIYSNKVYYILFDNDSCCGPVLHDATQFEVISNKIPSNWSIIPGVFEGVLIGPKAWDAPNFWTSCHDGDCQSLEIYNRELRMIVDTERNFYPVKVNELWTEPAKNDENINVVNATMDNGIKFGHFEDTPENRRIIADAYLAKNSIGSDKFANEIYVKKETNGTETWVMVRNEKIINFGFNPNPNDVCSDRIKQGIMTADIEINTNLDLYPEYFFYEKRKVSIQLTALQAFQVFYRYLVNENGTKGECKIIDILGSINTDTSRACHTGGPTVDPAVWQDWRALIKEVIIDEKLKATEKDVIFLTPEQALESMYVFLEQRYCNKKQDIFLKDALADIDSHLTGVRLKSTDVWTQWIVAVSYGNTIFTIFDEEYRLKLKKTNGEFWQRANTSKWNSRGNVGSNRMVQLTDIITYIFLGACLVWGLWKNLFRD